MSRKTLINTLENVFQPGVNQAMKEDLIGTKKKTWTLAAETVVAPDFGEYSFHEILLNTQNITINATVTGLEVGEKVYLKIVQDDAAARTVTFGTNILTDVTVTASTDAVDLLVGVFDGTNLIFGALAQAVS